MREFGVGVIGCGYWGPNLIRNFHIVPGIQLIAACDLREERVKSALRAYPTARPMTDVDAMLADEAIDLVAIATPVATHFPLVKRALEAGKHVLVEKPMTMTLRQSDQLVELADRVGRHLFVDHTFLFTPAVRKMKAMYDCGELGDLQFIDTVRINLGLFQHDVNVIWDLAPHDFAIINHLVERPPLGVSAVGAVHSPSGHADVAYVHLDYGNNLIAHIHVNWLSPVKVRRMILGGSRRSVIWDDLDPAFKVNVYDRGIDLSEKSSETESGARQIQEALINYRTGDMSSPHLPQYEALRAEVEHIVRVLAGEEEPLCCGRQGRLVVHMLEAAATSLREQGRIVLLEEAAATSRA
jgi:predicted dehydrogenase